ncbi:hypothetical protein C8J57DRAFT_1290995 [Mycena rebaudengoi]|nr:hypothetical protein C8J57DRAFT_1290995 [Mycena rebaudengoi]
MTSGSGVRLLKLALPLISEHGFTRTALARSPLSDTAVSALFGNGDLARKTLIHAWLDDGVSSMKTTTGAPTTIKDALHARLAYNEPVLSHLPEAFTLLSAPESGVPPFDPLPALKHAARIADEACHTSADQSIRLSWYARRASLIGIYSAAELHQLTSPETAHAFLDTLLSASATVDTSVEDVRLFSAYIIRSLAGIVKSSGVW